MPQRNQQNSFNSVPHQIGELRKELLDLSLRNPLLNFRQPRGKGLELEHPRPDLAFDLLTNQERAFSFLASANDEEDDSHDEFQTSLSKEQLEKRLLATYRTAQTFIDEQGVNTLFLAFGMLKWRDEGEDEFHRAPLILVPVKLDRDNPRQPFILSFNGEEIAQNVCLTEKVRQDYRLRLPILQDEDTKIFSYFEQVRNSIQSREEWTVEVDTVVLGFFSFAKFLMYRDLDPETWADSKLLLNHPLLNALLGDSAFTEIPSPVVEGVHLDDALRNCEPPLVDNADSTQMLALVESLAGRTMVVQGPPGTGKSQTIVNLISAAMSAGKKILFVSEKMAALKVVKQRLDQLGLGAPCLELHSNKTKKREIIDDLRKTAYGAQTKMPVLDAELALISAYRDRLNAYCSSVNEPIGDSGETPTAVYGKLVLAEEQLEGMEVSPVRFADSTNWTAEDIARRRLLAEHLRNAVSLSGPPKAHPYWGSNKRTYVPTEREFLARLLRKICASLDTARIKSAELAAQIGLPEPESIEQAEIVANTGLLLSKSPDLTGVDPLDSGWRQHGAEIRAAADVGDQMRIVHATFGPILTPDAWQRDVSGIEIYSKLANKWWRWLSPRWRQATKEFAALFTKGIPKVPVDASSVIEAILIHRRAQAEFRASATVLSDLLGPDWRDEDTDFSLLRSRLDWIMEAQNFIRSGKVSPECLKQVRSLQDKAKVGESASSVGQSLKRIPLEISDWRKAAAFSPGLPSMARLDASSFDQQVNHYAALASALDRFPALISYSQAAFACRNSGLADLVDEVESFSSGEEIADIVLPLFEKARLVPLIEHAFAQRPALAEFDGVRQSHTVEAFRKLDQIQLRFNRAACAARHCASIPVLTAAGQSGVLANQFERKAKFFPVRKLIERAGNAVQAIKPVFMMSPLSIANYLPPGTVEFDLAIFDEASQVEPVDALGAIARAKQVVVVGDSQQLPPTNFFDAMADDDDDDEGTAADDIESILGLFNSRRAHQRMLKWHYRSRHESLIAVSNRLFYDDQLVVFPSPEKVRPDLGLKFRHLPDAFYDRGGKRNNPVEARSVAQAVFDHARKQMTVAPGQRETLGVVAFSVAQKETIEDEIELLSRNNPDLDEFFGAGQNEPFFIKNLESVQGDERDVILISIGYARTVEGYLAMSFGPLNRTGGGRRLNVLITRARRRCVVFTNLTSDDIDLGRAPSDGARALKTFLSYAQTGRMEIATPTGGGEQSVFEEQVAKRLARHGYQVETQVGASGFFIDMAVVDPSKPGRYLLGVECDGATYHRARSARDRDRLRQAVLEGLGWKIYRIWSTDWFKDPKGQFNRLVEAIEESKSSSQPVAAEEPDDPFIRSESWKEAQNRELIAAQPYVFAKIEVNLEGVELHLVPRSRLSDWIVAVVGTETPVHRSEVVKRIASAAGLHRAGNRIQQALSAASDLAVAQRRIHRTGDFLWDLAVQRPIVRDRSSLPASSRRIDLVAPEEIESAILLIAEKSLGIELEHIPSEVARLLGFGRTSEETRLTIEQRAKSLIDRGKLELRGMTVVSVAPRDLR